MRAELADVRAATGRDIDAMSAMARRDPDAWAAVPEEVLNAVRSKLAITRARSDALLSIDRRARSQAALADVMPRMLGPSLMFGPLLGRAAADVSMPNRNSRASSRWRGSDWNCVRNLSPSPRSCCQDRRARGPTEAELDRVRELLSQADVTTKLMEVTFLPGEPHGGDARLTDPGESGAGSDHSVAIGQMIEAGPADGMSTARSSGYPGQSSSGLSASTTCVSRLSRKAPRGQIEQASRTRRLDLAMTAVGAVVLIILAALITLQRRVVGPLTQLASPSLGSRTATGGRRSSQNRPRERSPRW